MPIEHRTIREQTWTITSGPDSGKTKKQQVALGTEETPGKYVYIGPAQFTQNGSPILKENQIIGHVTDEDGKRIEGIGVWQKLPDFD